MDNVVDTDETGEPYAAIVKSVKELYKGNISDQEAHEAARNLIGFCQTLLAIEEEMEQNRPHAE